MKKLRATSSLFFLLAVSILTVSQVQGSSPRSTPNPPTPLPEEPIPPAGHLAQRYFDRREIGSGWLETQPQAVLPIEPDVSPGPVRATAVEVGFSHSCALTDQGGVRCWGDNYLGQLGDSSTENRQLPQYVIGLQSGVGAISSLHKHTCALTTAGGVQCWGYNFHGELGDGTTINSTVPIGALGLDSGVIDVSAGGFHSCALLSGGGVKCWGANWHGQLGNDTKIQSFIPVDVVNLGGPVVDIQAGKFHTCALLANGGVQCWGYNLHGEVGDGTAIDRTTPRDVIGLTHSVASVKAGGLHTCALRTDGTVYCWGENSRGQLGNGTLDDQSQPAAVMGLGGIVQDLHLGVYHTCAHLAAGGGLCWGDNWAGQLGDGTNEGRLTPVGIGGITDVLKDIDGGDSHTCGVTVADDLLCWGSIEVGQLGNAEDALSHTPVPVDGLAAGSAAMTSGNLHSCAITVSGGVRCWGNNRYGQLGDGTTTFRLSPVAVADLLPNVSVVASGGFHNCAIDASTGLKCWGDNTFGQIGDGTKAQRNTPTGVVGLSTDVATVTAGERHTCAMRTNGTVKCWGSNSGGRLGDGTNDPSGTPVNVIGLPAGVIKLVAGQSHTCALYGSGAVRCWGSNSDGQLGDGTATNRFTPVPVIGLPGVAVDLTAGISHTCVALDDGRAYCWGGNFSGQLGDGTFAKRLTPVQVVNLGADEVDRIYAGGLHTCALLNTGVAKCWGDNWKGQLGDGSTVFRAIPANVTGLPAGAESLSVGAEFSCARFADAPPQCWGSNGHGQLGIGAIPWQNFPIDVIGLSPAVLASDFTAGRPGSFFVLSGSGFPDGSTASVAVNGTVLSTSMPVDSSGNVSFSLDTTTADEGQYTVVVTSIVQAGTPILLSQSEPLHPPSGGTTLVVPPGIAFNEFSHLPVLRD